MVNSLVEFTPVSQAGYTRLQVDERRRQLLEFGAELFTRHAFDELSMAAIAREAGVSKALLYHYFPSKADFFEATLRQAADELAARTDPDPDLPPATWSATRCVTCCWGRSSGRWRRPGSTSRS